MGKRSLGRWGKGSSTEPFAMVPKRMLKSEAWKDLPFSAMVAWLYLKSQKINKNCNEHIKLPYKTVAGLFSSRTYSKALKSLFSHGFIDIEERGGLMNRPTVYRLSDEWENWKKGLKWDGVDWVEDTDTIQYKKTLQSKAEQSRRSFKK